MSDELKNKLNSFVKKASKNMNSIVGIGKDMFETTKLEKSLNECYQDLGRMLYQKDQESSISIEDHDIRDEIDKITQILEVIDFTKEEVKKKRESVFK